MNVKNTVYNKTEFELENVIQFFVNKEILEKVKLNFVLNVEKKFI